MPSEYDDSVEDLIARHLTIDADMDIHRLLSKDGLAVRNGDVEDILYRTIRGAVELVRRQLAEPREGIMSYEQALDAVLDGKLVTRPGWGILRTLNDGHEDSLCRGYHYNGHIILDFKLDNLDGFPSGSGGQYTPSEDDLAATDWMEHQPPRFVQLFDLPE